METLQVPQLRNRDHRDWLHESVGRPKEGGFFLGTKMKQGCEAGAATEAAETRQGPTIRRRIAHKTSCIL